MPTIPPEDLEHVTEVSVSAGRKKMLEKYEPIDTSTELTLSFSADTSAEEKVEAIADAEKAAWEATERSLTQRYEEYVREEAFGDD
jgi:hypothetical protein